MRFQSQKDNAQTTVSQYIKTIEDPVDMDKLIAKEELKLKLGDIISNTTEKIENNEEPLLKRRV